MTVGEASLRDFACVPFVFSRRGRYFAYYLFQAVNWQGRNQVYFFIADPNFQLQILIPDPKM